MQLQSAAWLYQSMFALAIVVGGWPILRNAYQEVFIAHMLGINTLMVMAVIGAMHNWRMGRGR